MDRLTAMETFVVAAKAKSFAQAAAQLRLTRAMVGKRIAQLEEHLKARLFNRTTRELSLTPAGRRYLEVCDRLIGQLTEEEGSLSSLQSEPVGEFRVLVVRSFGRTHVVSAAAEFLQLYPDLRMEVELSATSPTALQLVETGFDMGIRVYPPPAQSRMIAKKIADFDWVLCAAPRYLAAAGTPQSIDDLKNHSTIGALRHDHWSLSRRGRVHNVTTRPRLNVSSEGVRPAVLVGLGIALQPLYLIEDDLKSGDLVPVLPDYTDPSGEITVVYPHAKMLPAKVRLFTNFLVKRVRNRFQLARMGRR
jgi:DNA-binding transcriptional LysR family regulator